MTVVSGVMVRDRTPAMFDDLLVDYPGATYTVTRANGVTTLTFNVDLAPEVAAAIKERMCSRGDEDLADRSGLRDRRAAVLAPATPETLEDAIALIELLRAAVADGIDYVLGD